jgi:AcrR family transcriptional regulator
VRAATRAMTLPDVWLRWAGAAACADSAIGGLDWPIAAGGEDVARFLSTLLRRWMWLCADGGQLSASIYDWRMATRPYRSSVRRQAAELTRAKILDAAERLFEAHGYARITITQVAEAADVAANTVYTVFGSKGALVAALMERAATDPVIADTLERVESAVDGTEIIRFAAKGTGETVRRHERALAIVYANETADPLIADAARQADSAQSERLAEVAAQLVRSGTLRDGVGHAEASDVLAYYLGQASWRSLRRRGWGWQRCEDWLTRQVTTALLAALNWHE